MKVSISNYTRLGKERVQGFERRVEFGEDPEIIRFRH
jgi:hypothetical protein